MRVGYAITKEGKQEVKQLKTHTVITRVKQEVGTRKERTYWENMNSMKKHKKEYQLNQNKAKLEQILN